jgi:AcrR family transcriptional regulator
VIDVSKALSENEREFIRKRLIEEAEICLQKYGIRKTTVDELVKRVNIPKGTFYLFYQSKELLLFDVIQKFHDQIQSKLISQISFAMENMNALSFTDLLFKLYQSVGNSFLLPLISNGELDLLIRKLPKETAELHSEKDEDYIRKIVSLVPAIRDDRIEAFSAALRGVFFVMLHRHEVGEQNFDETIRIMIYGVVLQMFDECKL